MRKRVSEQVGLEPSHDRALALRETCAALLGERSRAASGRGAPHRSSSAPTSGCAITSRRRCAGGRTIPSSTSARAVLQTHAVHLAHRRRDSKRSCARCAGFGERLRGAARVRERHARRGRFDPHRTVRKSLATGGIPFRPARRDQRRDRPRLVVLCDVSDSVRTAARFMLEFVYAVQELFERTRSFVFVGELGEVTHLFDEERARSRRMARPTAARSSA